MSRLAFDDILKPSPNLGPSASRDDAKSRAASAKSEEPSLFDDKFKQAVKELRPNEKPDTDEKFDSAARNAGQSNDSSGKDKAEPSASDSKNSNRVESSQAKSDNEKPPRVDQQSSESDDLTDPDDALIAMVMAAALEQEEALAAEAEGEVTGLEAVEEVGDSEDSLVEETALVADSDLAEHLTAGEPTTASNAVTNETLGETSGDAMNSGEKDAAEKDVLPEASSQPESVESLIAASEVVVPQNVVANAEAAQATVATTEEIAATQADSANTDGATTQEASAAGAAQGNAGQQGDMDQDSNSEEGEAESEMAALEKLQTPTTNATSNQVEESMGQSTDNQQETADTSVKVETSVDRPAAATATETRSGQGTSTNTTQQTTEPTLDTTDRVRFVERVAQAFNAQSAENRTIRMRLHPEELGEIKLEVTVRNGAMHAKIETETREARNVLLDNLPALRERLANLDIKVEQFDIDYNAGGDQQGTPQNPDDWSDSGQNSSNRSSGNTNTTEEGEAIEESPTLRPTSRDGSGKQLDMTA